MNQTVHLQGSSSAADLPIAVAILLPGLTDATSIDVSVMGELSGTVVGQGELTATISPGQHTTAHLALTAVSGGVDGGEVDMASTDMAGYVPLTVTLAGDGTGTVTGAGIACSGTTCSGQYPPHTTVTLAPTPAATTEFAGWAGAGCTGTSPCAVTLDVATTLTATFNWEVRTQPRFRDGIQNWSCESIRRGFDRYA